MAADAAPGPELGRNLRKLPRRSRRCWESRGRWCPPTGPNVGGRIPHTLTPQLKEPPSTHNQNIAPPAAAGPSPALLSPQNLTRPFYPGE